MKKLITRHPLWRRWTQIKYQISNENSPRHHYYHGLPMVGFDNFWEFAEFVESEIGSIPDRSYRLARKDQRKGYVPGNIFWAESNIDVGQHIPDIYKFQIGRRKMTMREMAEYSGILEATIRSRLGRGWSAKDAVTIVPKLGQKIYG